MILTLLLVLAVAGLAFYLVDASDNERPVADTATPEEIEAPSLTLDRW